MSKVVVVFRSLLLSALCIFSRSIPLNLVFASLASLRYFKTFQTFLVNDRNTQEKSFYYWVLYQTEKQQQSLQYIDKLYFLYNIIYYIIDTLSIII